MNTVHTLTLRVCGNDQGIAAATQRETLVAEAIKFVVGRGHGEEKDVVRGLKVNNEFCWDFEGVEYKLFLTSYPMLG